jgi:hypothetical protein
VITRSADSSVPERAGLVLGTLILVAAVANVDGDNWAYIAAIIAVLVGMSLVYFLFPRKDEEEALRLRYHAEDSGDAAVSDQSLPPSAPAEARS